MRFVLTAFCLILVPFGAHAQRSPKRWPTFARNWQLGGELSALRQELVTTGAVAQAGGATCWRAWR
jgi:hypothetical protein